MDKKESEELLNQFIKFLKNAHNLDASTMLQLHVSKKAFLGEAIKEKRKQ